MLYYYCQEEKKMLFKIYYVKDNIMTFVNVLAENLIDKLNALRETDNVRLLCIQDCYGERFML